MGQLALGLRSLAVRFAVFVVLAALLAWILGGTLFPAPQRVNFPAWQFDGAAWNWRVSGSSTDAGPTAWTLFEHRDGDGVREQRFGLNGEWRQVWGPRFDAGTMMIGLALEPGPGSADQATQWWLLRFAPGPGGSVDKSRLDDEASLREVLGATAESAPL